MIRLVILILFVALGVWAFQAFAPEQFTKENMENTIKKEKTINAVQTQRAHRYKEAEEVMNSY